MIHATARHPRRFSRTVGPRWPLMAVVLTLGGCAADVPDEVPQAVPGYEAVADELRRLVRHEMETKGLPAVSIALVDGPDVVWAEGFGHADPGTGTPATPSTVYRVGSVSKLFTDIAVMQLVERGELDLDAPVSTYLPEFRPRNPFGGDITLRQLMSHRSGLVREPPVGNYFDPTEPTLAATIESLNETALVYAPEARPKYSNAAIATVGRVLEVTRAVPFVAYVDEAVLRPLGLDESAFEPRPELAAALARAEMWTVDGRVTEAPTFQLGMAPAGSMYSTVTDLGRFMSALFAGGTGVRGPVLSPESLEEMWTPQFAAPGATTGFGIGFALDELEGHRRIGHNGAIYGFATELQALPERGLGVVVVTSKDMANTVTERIADAALRLMLASSEGRALPAIRTTSPVDDALADRIAGHYRGGDRRIELAVRPAGLVLFRDGIPVTVRALGTGDTLVVDDATVYGPRLIPLDGGVVVGSDTLARVIPPRPPAPPARWEGLIGEYGWDHNTLYVLERDGRLHALIEWFFTYPLEEVSDNVFRFPDYGLYAGEGLVFTRDADGQAIRVEAASVVFERREVGTAAGETFRITPVRPVEELRAEALAAEPPAESGEFREPDLVDLSTVAETIRFDIRYASTNNFMSSVFYQLEKAFLQRPAAEALGRAHRALGERGYGVLIHDAYRPWYVTKMFFDATPEDMKIFVADPSQGSRHNRGAAVDLSLYDLATGELAHAVGGYDEFSPRSYPDYPGGTSLQRWHRALLREAMEAENFTVYEAEWWHFDYDDWRTYPIQNLTFEEILQGR
jgi:CubicO group peptidase (beta-lactamase class C family)/D-alanyl-D-alanine dipeptidase